MSPPAHPPASSLIRQPHHYRIFFNISKAGKVFLLPFTLCCWGEGNDPAAFRTDSRLIELLGERNEKGPGTWYYQIDDQKGWVVVREVPRPPLGQG